MDFGDNEIHLFEKKSQLAFNSREGMIALDYFKILLNEERFFEMILKETNNCQLCGPDLNQRIGLKKIFKFFGMILYSQLIELESIQDFWKEDSSFFAQLTITNMLKKKDFLTILENIVKLNARKNPDWVLEIINRQSKKSYIPSSNFVLHDRLIEIDSSSMNCYFLIDSENDYIFFSKFFNTKSFEYELVKSSFCEITFQKFVYFNENFDSKIIKSYSSLYNKVLICAFSQQKVSENHNFEIGNKENNIFTNFPSFLIDKICKADDKCIELSKVLEEKLECTKKIEKTNLFLEKKNHLFKSLGNLLYSLEIAIMNSYVLYKMACTKKNIIPQERSKFRLEMIEQLIG